MFNITKYQQISEFGVNVAQTPLTLKKTGFNIPQYSTNKGLRLITIADKDKDITRYANLQYNGMSINWEIPHINKNDDKEKTYAVDKTLCLLKDQIGKEFKFDKLQVTTSSKSKPVEITSMWKYTENDYFLNMDKNYTINVASGSPQFYYVDITNVTGLLEVNVISDGSCSTISIHPLKCPVPEFDAETTVRNQNFLETAILSINTDEYKNTTNEQGFFIKFSSFESNCTCNPTGKQIK